MVGPDASVVSESTSYTNEVCADCVENQALLRFSSKPEETQSRRAIKKNPCWVLYKFGPGETRTLTPKALDPKSSASTNFATGPIVSAI